jgi:hypothetical protein
MSIYFSQLLFFLVLTTLCPKGTLIDRWLISAFSVVGPYYVQGVASAVKVDKVSYGLEGTI